MNSILRLITLSFSLASFCSASADSLDHDAHRQLDVVITPSPTIAPIEPTDAPSTEEPTRAPTRRPVDTGGPTAEFLPPKCGTISKKDDESLTLGPFSKPSSERTPEDFACNNVVDLWYYRKMRAPEYLYAFRLTQRCQYEFRSPDTNRQYRQVRDVNSWFEQAAELLRFTDNSGYKVSGDDIMFSGTSIPDWSRDVQGHRVKGCPEKYCVKITGPSVIKKLPANPTESPTPYPTYSPTVALPKLTRKGNNKRPPEAFPLGNCEGDCDKDSDCQAGLKCFERTHIELVPGCAGPGRGGEDYCYDPNAKHSGMPVLNRVGNNGRPAAAFPLGQCEGDCDADSDCQGDLICSDNGKPVPGCGGTAIRGSEYCYDPKDDRTKEVPAILYAFSHNSAWAEFYRMLERAIKEEESEQIFKTNHFLRCGCESFCLDEDNIYDGVPVKATCYVEHLCGERTYQIAYAEDYPLEDRAEWASTGTMEVMEWFNECARAMYGCTETEKSETKWFRGSGWSSAYKAFPYAWKYESEGDNFVYGLGGDFTYGFKDKYDGNPDYPDYNKPYPLPDGLDLTIKSECYCEGQCQKQHHRYVCPLVDQPKDIGWNPNRADPGLIVRLKGSKSGNSIVAGVRHFAGRGRLYFYQSDDLTLGKVQEALKPGSKVDVFYHPTTTEEDGPLISWTCPSIDHLKKLEEFGEYIEKAEFMRDGGLGKSVPTIPCEPETFQPMAIADTPPPVALSCDEIESDFCMQMPGATCYSTSTGQSCGNTKFFRLDGSHTYSYDDVVEWNNDCLATGVNCKLKPSSSTISGMGSPRGATFWSASRGWEFHFANTIRNGGRTIDGGRDRTLIYSCETWEGAYGAKNFTGGAGKLNGAYHMFENSYGDLYHVTECPPSSAPTVSEIPTSMPSLQPTFCVDSYLTSENLNLALVLDLSYSTYDTLFHGYSRDPYPLPDGLDLTIKSKCYCEGQCREKHHRYVCPLVDQPKDIGWNPNRADPGLIVRLEGRDSGKSIVAGVRHFAGRGRMYFYQSKDLTLAKVQEALTPGSKVNVFYYDEDDLELTKDIGDVNGDGRGNTILDAQIAAVEDLLISIGESAALRNSNCEIELISFETDAKSHGVFKPLNDSDDAPNPELMEYIKKNLRAPTSQTEVIATNNGFTNFDAALDVAVDYFTHNATAGRKNLMVFLSDGEPNVRGDGDGEEYCTDTVAFQNNEYQCADLALAPGKRHEFCRGDDPKCFPEEKYQDCVRGGVACKNSEAVTQYKSEIDALAKLDVERLAIGVGKASNVAHGSALWTIDNNPAKYLGVLPLQALNLHELTEYVSSLCILNTEPPTGTPSASPSLSPTVSPAPSTSPSLAPSVSPTLAPTMPPTTPPSRAPIVTPTFSPTPPVTAGAAACQDILPLPGAWGVENCEYYSDEYCKLYPDIRDNCCHCGGGTGGSPPNSTNSDGCTNTPLPEEWASEGTYDCDSYGPDYCDYAAFRDNCCFCGAGTMVEAPTDTPTALPTALPTSLPTTKPTSRPTAAQVPAVELVTHTAVKTEVDPNDSFSSVGPEECPGDIVMVKHRGVTPYPEDTLRIQSRNETHVTVELVQKWSSTNSLDAIFYQYRTNFFSNQCFEEADVAPDASVEFTLKCTKAANYGLLEVWIADDASKNTLVSPGDNAVIPDCCHRDPEVIPMDTPVSKYVVAIKCTTECPSQG